MKPSLTPGTQPDGDHVPAQRSQPDHDSTSGDEPETTEEENPEQDELLVDFF